MTFGSIMRRILFRQLKDVNTVFRFNEQRLCYWRHLPEIGGLMFGNSDTCSESRKKGAFECERFRYSDKLGPLLLGSPKGAVGARTKRRNGGLREALLRAN